MTKTGLEDWLRHLETLHPQEMELGLARVRTVAETLQLLPPPCPVITVAGTNGKGSTVAVLDAVLTAAGKRTGCFTSPHFLRFNERIRVAGAEVEDEDIVAAFGAIEAARGAISLTYFEFATLAALWVFAAREVDIVVLEVGLGGRLDSANIVDPAVAVITSIDLDHQQWLGPDRNAIGREKAGIMRPHRPVVIADRDPPPSLTAHAEAIAAAPVLRAGRHFDWREEPGGGWRGFIAAGDGGRQVVAGAAGALLPSNICAALQAAACLGIDCEGADQAAAIAAVSVAGRRQWLEWDGRRYLLDVAHNPAAIHKLLEYLDASACHGRVVALFSAMQDKPVAEMVALCAPHFDGWFLGGQPDNPRAMDAAAVAQLLRRQGCPNVDTSDTLELAFQRAQGALQPGDTLVVFGSFFTVAAVAPHLDPGRNNSEAV